MIREPRTPCSQPNPCEDGELCGNHEVEQAHAEGEHAFCGVTCEVEFPTEMLRNGILAKGYPGTAGMLDELLRRAASQKAVSSKPPLPARMFDPWPRIPVDTEDADFRRIGRIGGHAATQWVLGPEGTYKQNLTLAETVDGAVREALLHLLELGLIDIDADRLNAAPGWPMSRIQTGTAARDDDAKEA